MAQDDDFELPLTAAPGEHANDAAQEPIQQTHQHDAQSEPITSTAARRNRISLPHTHGLRHLLRRGHGRGDDTYSGAGPGRQADLRARQVSDTFELGMFKDPEGHVVGVLADHDGAGRPTRT
jgi:hypothetical protein